jgi:hypothetical protein
VFLELDAIAAVTTKLAGSLRRLRPGTASAAVVIPEHEGKLLTPDFPEAWPQKDHQPGNALMRSAITQKVARLGGTQIRL